MKLSKIATIFVITSSLLALSPVAHAQTVSGQITGEVADDSGAVIAGAAVRLTNDLSKQVRVFTSDAHGTFIFTGLVPGNYSVNIAQPGFKTYNQAAINVGAQESVDLHTLRLTVGDVTTAIEVTGAAVRVQSDSSDRAITINQTQIENTPTAGRNVMDVFRSLPGTTITTTPDSRGWNSVLIGNGQPGGAAAGINGNPGQFVVTLDGVASQDSGFFGNVGGYLSPSPDAVGEVKVLVGNYTAEYGARGGGQMNVSVKNGTNQYHGSVYWYYRHESLNANTFFNNKNTVTINGIPGQAQPRTFYRYQNPGGTFGGPLLIPGTNFNRSRSKLFFFFSEDYLHNNGTATTNFRMPTDLEKAGNFSQTFTTASPAVLVPIIDPSTGAQFPNNTIPGNRISPIGNAMIQMFPTGGPAGKNNYVNPNSPNQDNTIFYFNTASPREDRILRVDYNLTPKTSSYVRLIQDYYGSESNGSGGTSGAGNGFLGPAGIGWGQIGEWGYDIPAAGAVATVIHTFKPNLINEFTFGINRGHQMITANDPKFAAAKLPALVGPDDKPVSLTNLFGANDLGIIPNLRFTGTGVQTAGQAYVGDAPNFAWDGRFPFNGTDQVTSFTDNVTWIVGKHSLKFGFYLEHNSRNVSVGATNTSEGTYWFASDKANPGDTNYPLSNMLLGTVQAYGEDNRRLVNHSRYNQPEFFVQDTWRINRRLTLDIGLRMASVGALTSRGATLGVFDPAQFNGSKAGQLLYPSCTIAITDPATACPTANQVAVNPATRATYSIARQASFDPLSYGTGSPYSGIQQYSESFWQTPKPGLGPAIGLAWDVFGTGKTALRAGFRIFYDRPFNADTIGGLMRNPPAFQAPIVYNATFSSLLSAQAFLTPQGIQTGSRSYLLPSVYDWSIGIQQDIGKGFILDVAGVGNVHHHGFGSVQDINGIAPYTTWKPVPDSTTTPTGEVIRFLDPTAKFYQAPASPTASSFGSTGTFYNTNLIRSMVGGYTGFGSISQYTSIGEGYYDSLQVQINRRFGRRLQLATNYTWQKTITYGHSQWINSDYLFRDVSGVPHAVNVNFGYKLQNGSSLLPWKNGFTKAALDGWNINGVGAFFMGTPLGISCSYQNAPNGYYTGTPTPQGIPSRCNLSGPLFLPEGSTPATPGAVVNPTIDPKLWYPFNANSFSMPAANSLGIGNAPPTLTYGPGFENLDLSMYKQFSLGKEGRNLELRAEAFNAFNHFNPGNPNIAAANSTNLQWNFLTGAQTASNLGLITTQNGNSRRMSLSLRIRF